MMFATMLQISMDGYEYFLFSEFVKNEEPIAPLFLESLMLRISKSIN